MVFQILKTWLELSLERKKDHVPLGTWSCCGAFDHLDNERWDALNCVEYLLQIWPMEQKHIRSLRYQRIPPCTRDIQEHMSNEPSCDRVLRIAIVPL